MMHLFHVETCVGKQSALILDNNHSEGLHNGHCTPEPSTTAIDKHFLCFDESNVVTI